MKITNSLCWALLLVAGVSCEPDDSTNDLVFTYEVSASGILKDEHQWVIFSDESGTVVSSAKLQVGQTTSLRIPKNLTPITTSYLFVNKTFGLEYFTGYSYKDVVKGGTFKLSISPILNESRKPIGKIQFKISNFDHNEMPTIITTDGGYISPYEQSGSVLSITQHVLANSVQSWIISKRGGKPVYTHINNISLNAVIELDLAKFVLFEDLISVDYPGRGKVTAFDKLFRSPIELVSCENVKNGDEYWVGRIPDFPVSQIRIENRRFGNASYVTHNRLTQKPPIEKFFDPGIQVMNKSLSNCSFKAGRTDFNFNEAFFYANGHGSWYVFSPTNDVGLNLTLPEEIQGMLPQLDMGKLPLNVLFVNYFDQPFSYHEHIAPAPPNITTTSFPSLLDIDRMEFVFY